MPGVRTQELTRQPGTVPPAVTGTSRARLRRDRLARWTVTGGGVTIILAILGILVFILMEILPLLLPAEVSVADRREAPVGAVQAAVTDEHLTHAATLGADGVLRVLRLSDAELVAEHPVLEGARRDGPALLAAARNIPGEQAFMARTADGCVLHVALDWQVAFGSEGRRTSLAEPSVTTFDSGTGGAGDAAFTVRHDSATGSLAVVASGPRRLVLVRRIAEENPITGEVRESFRRSEVETPVPVRHLLLDQAQANLYAVAGDGILLWWPVQGGSLGELRSARVAGRVSALLPLLGERALVVGTERGGLSLWFPLTLEGGRRRLQRIRSFPRLPGAIRDMAPSMRNRSFLVQGGGGTLALCHSTSGRRLWSGRSPLESPASLFLAPKDDGALLAGDGRYALLAVDNPHPEAALGTYFTPTWYEDHEEPAHIWQSTGGEEYEPKLSLVTLLFGTLKGTLYALLLAVPMAVLAAMYCSQFLHASYTRYVKPVVELMASLPSVVLGLIAGLWLAPRLAEHMPSVLLMAVLLPACMVAAGCLWGRLPSRLRGRLRPGSEIFLLGAAVLLGGGLSLALGGSLEEALFGGSFPRWVRESLGLSFDQRNSVVIGIAMGFAVIPIIFTISEEAFSNVPPAVTSASLALGADRWQTVTRVVLPMASPGIFSAVMVGFGRAVGETMIVVMATGNTPLMELNPFSGFRTLSAAIAIELPEAPHGSTLYRTLFLAAGLLFALTFVVNTVADVVRRRLRRRFESL